MKIGILGFGRFGQLWANALTPFGEVKVYDHTINPASKANPAGLNNRIKLTTLEDAVNCDLLFLLVPICELKTCCEDILPHLKPETVVIDACSVKIYPVEVMQKVLPKNQPIIATHPLFGPDSIQRTGGLKGHKMVICPIQCTEKQQTQLTHLLNQLDLEILITTPMEHDRQMANSQSLVHLIGRGLAALNLQPQAIATPDFQALLKINQMVIHDTWQLFLDMHRYNPFSSDIRQKFIQQLNQLQEEIHMIIPIDQPHPIQQTQSTLEELREQINQIDASIIQKLAERQKVSKQVGALKARTGKAVLDTKREEALMQYYEKLSTQWEIDPEFVKKLFKSIIAHSRQLQK